MISREHPTEICPLEMGPDIFDDIQFLATVGGQPEGLNPFVKAVQFRLGSVRRVTGAVVQHENDFLSRPTCSIRQQMDQSDRLLGDRVLPEAVREQKRPIRIPEGTADADAPVLP